MVAHTLAAPMNGRCVSDGQTRGNMQITKSLSSACMTPAANEPLDEILSAYILHALEPLASRMAGVGSLSNLCKHVFDSLTMIRLLPIIEQTPRICYQNSRFLVNANHPTNPKLHFLSYDG
jgi:hypothetical protein